MTDNAWNEAVTLEGLNLRDKEELVGTPFVITGVWFETSKTGINYVYVEAEEKDGTAFCFNDSSSGVRADVIDYLTRAEQDHIIESGDPLALVPPVMVPEGLRKSEYLIEEKNAAGRATGRTRPARTFYLTKSGKPRIQRPDASVKPVAKKAAAPRP